MDKSRIFDIISFTAEKRRYYPASIGKQTWMTDNYITHTEIDFDLGRSRYGGPIIDLPANTDIPENLRFAAQLDLSEFSPLDKTGLLPEAGQLIFFADIRNDTGKVIYYPGPNDKLVRHIVEHDDNFFDGVLIDKLYPDTETFEERFVRSDDNEPIWDDLSGSEKSKIFGIYTNCQFGFEAIRDITFSEKLVLLQVGENGFNDEGVLSILISKKDLENKDFDNCEFVWAQS